MIKHFINHRINTLEALENVPQQNGIELDIRYHENDLVLHHDPFHHHETNPQPFESLVRKWNHQGPMILNVKTEGVEIACIEMMNRYEVTNWFFLDLSMPYFALYAEKAATGEITGFTPENLAVRFSEREPIEYALSFTGKAGWVWVDCFTHLPLNQQNYQRLTEAGFKLCIVSPELQKHPLSKIEEFRRQLEDMPAHAVCTKRPDLWGQEAF